MSKKGWKTKISELVDVCMGRAFADLVICNGNWVCVQTGEILGGTDIAVKGERIAYVGKEANHTIGPTTHVIDAGGRFMIPGLLDGHTHIESTMLTTTEMVRAVLPHGTTGIFVDPHEIANVFGMDGIQMMVEEADSQPIHVWIQMASCVPSLPELETSGAQISLRDIEEAMSWSGIIGLGEMMNYSGVIHNDENLIAEIAVTKEAGKVIGGHYASLDLGIPFHAYAAAGLQDDHEGTRIEDALARARQGMKVMMRYRPGLKDAAAQLPAVIERGLDPRSFILVTDGIQCRDIIHEGHLDEIYRHAIRQGLQPMTALQMMTINTAEHFGLGNEIGMIAPQRYADILLVSDLHSLEIEMVIARGKLAVENGELLLDIPAFKYPSRMLDSVHMARELTAKDFKVEAPLGINNVNVNVIGVLQDQAPTRHLKLDLDIVSGAVQLDMTRDIAKVAVIDRHSGSGRIQTGFIQGFGFADPCAVGSTIAHDSHQLVVVGTDESNMAVAANVLARIGGGQIVVRDKIPIAQVELPIAGLMSTERAESVAMKMDRLHDALDACGCRIKNANQQISYIPLLTIPELRLSDKGLVDVNRSKIISRFNI